MSCRENGIKQLTTRILIEQGRNPVEDRAGVLQAYRTAPKRNGREAFNNGATELLGTLGQQYGVALGKSHAKGGKISNREQEQTAYLAERMATQGLFPPSFLAEQEKTAKSPQARICASVLRRFEAQYQPPPTPTEQDTAKLQQLLDNLRYDNPAFSREFDPDVTPIEEGADGQQTTMHGSTNMNERDIHAASQQLLWMRRRQQAVERDPRLAVPPPPAPEFGSGKTIRIVHLTTEDQARKIARHGLRKGSFVVPWTGNPQMDLEWMRELRKWNGGKRIVSVELDVPANMQMEFGHYNGGKTLSSAAQAAGARRDETAPSGFEMITEHPIPASAVRSIKQYKQTYGWRHFPWSKGSSPQPWSTKGEPRSALLRKRLGGETSPWSDGKRYPTPKQQRRIDKEEHRKQQQERREWGRQRRREQIKCLRPLRRMESSEQPMFQYVISQL